MLILLPCPESKPFILLSYASPAHQNRGADQKYSNFVLSRQIYSAVALIVKREASAFLQAFSVVNCAPAAAIPVVAKLRVCQGVSEKKRMGNLSLRQFFYL